LIVEEGEPDIDSEGDEEHAVGEEAEDEGGEEMRESVGAVGEAKEESDAPVDIAGSETGGSANSPAEDPTRDIGLARRLAYGCCLTLFWSATHVRLFHPPTHHVHAQSVDHALSDPIFG
jgi:hypothetical protein